MTHNAKIKKIGLSTFANEKNAFEIWKELDDKSGFKQWRSLGKSSEEFEKFQEYIIRPKKEKNNF